MLINPTHYFLRTTGLGAAAWALVIGIVADALGRRRMLTLISLLAAASGIALVLAPAYPILVVFGFLGAFTAMAGNSGALVPLEQASIASTTPVVPDNSYTLKSLTFPPTLSIIDSGFIHRLLAGISDLRTAGYSVYS